MTPTLTFIIVLLVGVVVGIAAQRMARASWLSRQIAGGRRADLTSALVGIAGAFIGFHIGAIIALSAGMILLFIFAIVGAVLVLWGWREIKL
jgi:uncharacterized membrane protein YeaQ/YmgE (transglycosylase-associated protein family)